MITNGKFLSHIPPAVTPPQNHKNGFPGSVQKPEHLQNPNRKTLNPNVIQTRPDLSPNFRVLGQVRVFHDPRKLQKNQNQNFINLF